MRIVLAGATGFLGKALVRRLTSEGHELIAVSQSAVRATQVLGVPAVSWEQEALWKEAVQLSDAVINLAGASVAARRWNAPVKAELRSSRIEPTRKLAQAGPKVLLSASAVGIYGDHEGREILEDTLPTNDFFGELAVDWEAAAREAQTHGARVVLLRIGQVLGPGGGVLEAMLHPPQVPFSPWMLGLGGPLGSGKQWVPWVHIDDVVGLFLHALTHESLTGPMNVVAPKAVTARQLAQLLGKALGKPALVPVPLFALKALVGEFAEYLVTSQRVSPERARASGYTFQHPELTVALLRELTSDALPAP